MGSPRKDFGLRQPLHDIELLNFSAIARNINRVTDYKHIPVSDSTNLSPEVQLRSSIPFIKTSTQTWKGKGHVKNLYHTMMSLDNLTDSLFKKFRKRNLGSPSDVLTLLNNYNKNKNNSHKNNKHNNNRNNYNKHKNNR